MVLLIILVLVCNVYHATLATANLVLLILTHSCTLLLVIDICR